MDNAGLYDCQTQLSRMDVDVGNVRTEVNYLTRGGNPGWSGSL